MRRPSVYSHAHGLLDNNNEIKEHLCLCEYTTNTGAQGAGHGGREQTGLLKYGLTRQSRTELSKSDEVSKGMFGKVRTKGIPRVFAW